MIYLDGKGKSHKERYREIPPRRSKLAEEIVFAYVRELISRESVKGLLRELLFEEVPVNDVEETFYEAVLEPEILEYCLRGYKMDPSNLRDSERELVEVLRADYSTLPGDQKTAEVAITEPVPAGEEAESDDVN